MAKAEVTTRGDSQCCARREDGSKRRSDPHEPEYVRPLEPVHRIVTRREEKVPSEVRIVPGVERSGVEAERDHEAGWKGDQHALGRNTTEVDTHRPMSDICSHPCTQRAC